MACFFNKNHFQPTVLAKSKGYMIIVIKYCYLILKLIVIFVYFNFNLNLSLILQEIESYLLNVPIECKEFSIILGRYFNAKIGDLNNFTDEEIFTSPDIFSSRDLVDQTIKREEPSRVNNDGLFVLNGRTRNDCPGKFTVTSTIGSSTINYVWVDYEFSDFFRSFEVMQIPTSSDNVPIKVSISTDLIEKRRLKVYKSLKWEDNLKKDFREFLDENDPWGLETEDMSKAITEVIYAFAASNNMIQRCIAYPIHKPWIDRKFRLQKIALEKLLKQFKKNHFLVLDQTSQYVQARVNLDK